MLDQILEILITATTAGAIQVLNTRQSRSLTARYKDRSELVTTADERSDAIMRSIFETQLAAIDSEISFNLEESGPSGGSIAKHVGADPLDGTNHFAAGGQHYSIQAHYVENGVPLCGVVFQPEAYLPLAETNRCLGRLAYAIRGQGALVERTEFAGSRFLRSNVRHIERVSMLAETSFVACVPIGTKMNPEERARAQRVLESGVVSVTTGVGGAGGNVMMTIFGGHHVYANFGAGEDLDLIPPQVIAEEAGMTVWGLDRKPPIWHLRKQAFVVAPSPAIAERFLQAAGL